MNPHHDKNQSELPRLNRIIGQLNGAKKKIESGEHCRDIVHLLRSANKALEALEGKILKYHIEERVHDLNRRRTSEREKQEILEELLRIYAKKSF